MEMTEQEKRDWVIEGLEFTLEESGWDANEAYDQELMIQVVKDAIALLRAQEPREITKEEWEQWKKTPDGKRDPLYFMWVDCAPGCWAMRPEDIHELAYLMGEIKIWNKKPSYGVMMQYMLNGGD